MQRGLLCKAKVCQFEDRIFLFTCVQQVLWLEVEAAEENK